MFKCLKTVDITVFVIFYKIKTKRLSNTYIKSNELYKNTESFFVKSIISEFKESITETDGRPPYVDRLTRKGRPRDLTSGSSEKLCFYY